MPFPGNQLPAAAINAVARNVVNLYPLGNVSPSLYRETLLARNELDQAGLRVDLNASSSHQLFGRYSYSGGHNINPVSVRGTDVPGYPTRDDLETHSALVSSTQILSPTLTHSLRATWLRHQFLFDQRLNRHPPSELGFGYESANAIGQGPPFFNVSGYSPIGGAITGPRNSTQTTFEVQDSVTWSAGTHLLKMGGELRRNAIDMVQAIAPNAFYVFAGTFPTNNAVANLLLGAPVTFYQGLGDFNRGLRLWSGGLYAQDEWRLGSGLTLNYGVRYERIDPFTEVEDRLNGFIPGVQSQVRPDAPVGLVFPGDPGIGEGIAHGAHTLMPRLGVAWDPTGAGIWSVRSSYGLYYDQFQTGSGTTSQVAISAIPSAQFNQFSGAGLNFQNPYQGRHAAVAEHLRAAVHRVRHGRRREAAVFAELEPERAAIARQPIPRRGSLRRRGRIAAAAERRGQPRRLRARRHRAERRSAAHLRQLPGRRRHLRLLDYRDAHERRQLELPFGPGQPVAPVRGRPRLQRVVLAVEVARPPVGDESLGRGGAPARRRERPRAEPVRSRRRVRSLALRRAASRRRQRELGAAAARRHGCGARARSSTACSSTSSPRTTRARPSPSPTPPTSRSRPTARRSPDSRRAGRMSSAIRMAARAPWTPGSAGRRSSG